MIEVLTSLDRNPAEFSRQAIDSAEQEISAVVYKFTDPSILEALDRALLRRVHIKLLMDGKEAYSANNKAGQLSSMGAEVRLWGQRGEKLHAKFVVLDRSRVYTGSSNWTTAARKSNMELMMKLEGSTHVERFMEIFERLWAAGTQYPDEGHRDVNRS